MRARRPLRATISLIVLSWCECVAPGLLSVRSAWTRLSNANSHCLAHCLLTPVTVLFFSLLSRWLRLKSRNYSEALIRSVLTSLQEPCSPHSRWLHAGSGLRRLSEQRKAKEKRKFRARLQKPSRQQESARCFVIHRQSVCRFPSLFSCGRRRDLVENRSKH